MKTKIQIIVGSTRQNRFSEKPAAWLLNKMSQISDIEVELVDLRDYPLPFFDEPISPSMKKEPYRSPVVKKWTQKIGEADGYIIITPEYNHGYPAVLKNALDYVYQEWNNKPVGFVSYGTVGGARAVEQLRQVALELQMVPVRAAVHIVAFWNLLDDRGNLITDSLEKSADTMIEQVTKLALILKQARQVAVEI